MKPQMAQDMCDTQTRVWKPEWAYPPYCLDPSPIKPDKLEPRASESHSPQLRMGAHLHIA